MRPLKDLLDQFVPEGVLIQDNNCDFAEDNMQLETTANQLP